MPLLNTYTSYQFITKDIPKSIDRIEQQPMVDRDTKYYLANITKVKSIDDFVNNDRLFKYAMKAYGLEDMDYAKAFMVKALKEGVSDPDSFANKLTDKRYAEFVSAFNFAANGADATIYNKAQQLVTKNYATQAQIAGLDPNSDYVKGETSLLPRQHHQGEVHRRPDVEQPAATPTRWRHSVSIRRPRTRTSIKQVLEGGVARPRQRRQQADRQGLRRTGLGLQFRASTARTPPPSTAAQQPTVDKYMRQTLEEDAGKTNEGVRLALYFQRKAPTITSWYDVLADTALRQRRAAPRSALPDSFATADIDKQAQLFEQKLDLADFSDPDEARASS